MSKRDFYEVLGIQKGVTSDELKKAYRKLAMRYHPDKNPGDKSAEEKFREATEAYEVLKDDQKRAAYDRFGHAAFDPSMGGAGAQGGHHGAHGFDFSGGFADIFDEMFGGGRSRGERHTSERGSDVRYNLDVTMEEAFSGTTAKIRYLSAVACSSCQGTGAADGAKPQGCDMCHGRGSVRAQQGFFTLERTCPKCDGSGQMIEKPCRPCQGGGRVRQEKAFDVKIPAGVDEGTRIRVSGGGEAGPRNGPTGDLYVFVHLKPHRLFRRDGSNIYCRIPIPMATAALGGEIEVPTIDGHRAKVKIPAGTQNGHSFRLRGKGMSVLRRTTRGDMYIEAAVETPMNLTKKQKELLAEFAKGSKKDNSPQSTNFFDKVKEFWTDLGASGK